MSERNVTNKNFVFVGGSHGMGRAAAIELATRGANILIVSRGKEAAQAAIDEAKQRGANSAEFLAADLSTIDGIKAAAEAIKAWKPEIHGIMHTAMSAFKGRTTTADDLDFAFALQYLARASINRTIKDNLAASGDGRVVHIAGNVSKGMAGVDLDDLQFKNRKWSFFKSILGTHYLGFLSLQEATERWADLPITLAASCVESVKTKAMLDPDMPLIMRLMGRFGTTPEKASRNAVTLLTCKNTDNIKGVMVPSSKRFQPKALNLDKTDAHKLWDITTDLAASKGMILPN